MVEQNTDTTELLDNEDLTTRQGEESYETTDEQDETVEIETDSEEDAESNEDANPEEDEVTRLRQEVEELRKAKNESYQEWQRLNWVTKIQADKFDYIKLYESDKKMAQKVLDHFGDDSDPRELYTNLRKEKFGEGDVESQKEEILYEIEKKNTKKEFTKLVKEAGIDLTSKKGKEFVEEYNLLTDNGRRVNTDNVETFINKAIKLSDIETIDTKQKRKEKELPVGHTTRNNAKPSKPKEILNFWGARPSEWYT